MKKYPDNNFGIAHLGINFLLAATLATFGNTVLLSLDPNGHILDSFSLADQDSDDDSAINPEDSSAVKDACVALAKHPKTFSLVRIKVCPANDTDPFRIQSPVTQILYDTVQLYGHYMTEVIRPHLQFRS